MPPKHRTCVARRPIRDLYTDGGMDAACEIVAEGHVFHVPAGDLVETSWIFTGTHPHWRRGGRSIQGGLAGRVSRPFCHPSSVGRAELS